MCKNFISRSNELIKIVCMINLTKTVFKSLKESKDYYKVFIICL